MKIIWSIAVAFSLVLAGTASAAAKPDIEGKEVSYRATGVEMKGYLAYDRNVTGERPGVLVVHEWWGLNEYARKRARMLAEMGYTALAVDMYGGGKQAMHPDDAGKFSSELMKNFDTAKARFVAALDFLKKQPTVDPERIAAIGYCFGGGIVLNMARQGVDLKGVASFHGSLAAVKPAQQGVKAKLLVLHGADDKFVTSEQIVAFKQEMTNAGADFRLIEYPGAIHSFTNPDADEYAKKFNLPLGYNAEADKKSWEELTKFLGKIFRK
ncbi:MAG TPA: dienelactone hydrolase family protein [Thermodesulfovibrionales bacterium]|nr:dienelactone hydrolase family protein [Thermodesulfovibrionales bacterium]